MKNIEILKCRKLDNYHSNDFFSELFARAKKSVVKTLTGIPPLTFTADGTPLLDYLISGNTTQSGTPTPDSPIMPQGTGDKTANLLSYDYLFSDDYAKQSTYFRYYRLQLAPNTQYTIKTNYIHYSAEVPLFFGLSDTMSTATDGVTTNVARTITTGADGIAFIARRIMSPIEQQYVVSYDKLVDGTYYIMLNTGSTALPYEPFGVKIPISSGDTTTNNYLGEVETTRQINKLVLTGEENFSNQYGTNLFSVQIQPLGKMGFFDSYCTHYKYNPVQSGLNANTQNGEYALQVQSTQTLLAIKDVTYTSPEDFKTYLADQYAAGTPVCVWYVLATETTGIVNEPLMRIGDYADTLSKTQAGVTIPTNNGSTTVDVDTTVKPSEVYIKYMG